MNQGARAAHGDLLLFLHADCRLECGWAEAIDHEVQAHGRVAGCLEQAIDAPGCVFRWIGALAMARARVLRVFYGDQGIWVRRDLFDRLGGFREGMPLLEDIEFSRRLRRSGPLGVARSRVHSSARDWQRHGLVRTMLRNWGIALLYGCGVAPETLAPLYPTTHPQPTNPGGPSIP